MKKFVFKEKGMILILALWSLSLLAFFAVYLGVGVRQKIIFLSRLETRSLLRSAARSGVKKAIMYLCAQKEKKNLALSLQGKMNLMNNKDDFEDILVGNAYFSIQYLDFDKSFTKKTIRYGMMDEESKLNINVASKQELSRLFYHVLTVKKEQADELALSVVDWRDFGDSVLDGFFSSRYYENLKHPYSTKNGPFETLDELRVVKGITSQVYDKIIPFLTIYGDGIVNINTASRPVLVSIGIDEGVVDVILSIRQGPDGQEATKDDFIFTSMQAFRNIIKTRGNFSDREMNQVFNIVEQGRLKTESAVYTIESVSRLSLKEQSLAIRCVYDTLKKKILYWSEG